MPLNLSPKVSQKLVKKSVSASFSQKASERLNFDKKKIIQVFLEVNQFSDGVERKLKGNFGQRSQISPRHRIRSRVF